MRPASGSLAETGQPHHVRYSMLNVNCPLPPHDTLLACSSPFVLEVDGNWGVIPGPASTG